MFPLPSWHFIMTETERGRGYSLALRPLAFHLYSYAGLLLGLGADWCQMLPLASIFSAVRPPASCFMKSGLAFHQTLIGLGLAFNVPQTLAECWPLAVPSSGQNNAGLWSLTLAQ